MAARWLLAVGVCLAVLGGAALGSETATSFLGCVSRNCTFNLGVCRNHTECNGLLACAVACRNNSESLAPVKQLCIDSCQASANLLNSNTHVLWGDLLTCYSNFCPFEYGSDHCSGYTLRATCEQVSGCYFSNGTCYFEDPTPPVFSSCPLDQQLPTTVISNGTRVYWNPIFAAKHAIAMPVTLVSGYESGAVFPVGVTPVVYTTRDVAGNAANCTFTVTITDPYAPELTFCPGNFRVDARPEDFVADGTGQARVNVTWPAPTATDNVGFTWVAPSPAHPRGQFPVGDTPVQYVAADAAGNRVTCSFVVTVPPPSLAQFEAAEHRYVARAVDPADAAAADAVVDYLAGVPLDACAALCLHRDGCSAFLGDRAGAGRCVLLLRPLFTDGVVAAALEFAADFDTYRRLGASLAVCPGQVLAENCYTSYLATLGADVAGAPCLEALANYTECAAAALADCTNPRVLALWAVRNATYEAQCAGAAPWVQTFPPATNFACAGPFAAFGQCVACCHEAESTATADCRVVSAAGFSGGLDAACVAARHALTDDCLDACFNSRPFNSTGGSLSDISNTPPTNVTGALPPTGFVNLRMRLTFGGVSVAALDTEVKVMFLLQLAATFGLDVETLELVEVAVVGTSVTVEIASQTSESLQLPALPAGTMRRRRGETAADTDAVDVVTLTLEGSRWTELRRDRRSAASDLLALLANDALLQSYMDQLLSLLQQQNPAFNASTLQSFLLDPSYSAAHLLLSTTTTPGPTTTTTTLPTVTTTMDPGLLLQSAATAATSSKGLSTGVVVVIAVCVSFLAIAVFVLLVAFFKGRSSRKVALAAGRRTMHRDSPGASRASAAFVTPASAFALPPMRPPVAGDPFAAPAAGAFAAPAALPPGFGASGPRGGPFARNNAVAPMPSPMSLKRVPEA